jgi:hypothetical protein
LLARRREQILIIGGLIGLNILLGWFLEQHWKEYRSRSQWVYAHGSPQPLAARAASLNQEAGQPQSFVEIVDRNVFSPLRGHPPPQPPEAAKPPKPPLLFGTMNLGNGWFALMAPGDQPSPASKRVLPGEEIGGYKLVSIGTSNVVIEWQEKKINLDISDSVRQASIEKTASTGSRSATVTGTASNPVTSVKGSGGFISPARSASPAASPDVPAGTVIGGKQKVVVQTPFGATAHWVDVGTPGIPPQQTGAPNK